MRVAILVPAPYGGERPDQVDTYDQAGEVAECLARLGHESQMTHYADHGARTETNLAEAAPDVVFNLVEEVPEGPHEVHRATATLDRLGLRYTGVRTSELEALGDKRAMKAYLRGLGLPVVPSLGEAPDDATFIVKHAFEHGSVGLEATTNVVEGADAARAVIAERQSAFGGEWYAEAYIEGREFDVSILGARGGIVVMPVAEVAFTNHRRRPKVFGYASKWDPEGPDSYAVMRVFPPDDRDVATVRALAVEAWEKIGLAGFAHVDFRVDPAGRPYILEVNANPCLLRTAGFVEAAEQLGMTQTDVVAALLEAA